MGREWDLPIAHCGYNVLPCMKVRLARKQAAALVLQQGKAAFQCVLRIQQAQAVCAVLQAQCMLLQLHAAGCVPALLQGMHMQMLLVQRLVRALLQGLGSALQLQGMSAVAGVAHGGLQQTGVQVLHGLLLACHARAAQLVQAHA